VPIFSAVREHCPPEKPFAIRHSPFAAFPTCRMPTSLCSRPADLPISRPAERLGSALTMPSHYIYCRNLRHIAFGIPFVYLPHPINLQPANLHLSFDPSVNMVASQITQISRCVNTNYSPFKVIFLSRPISTHFL